MIASPARARRKAERGTRQACGSRIRISPWRTLGASMLNAPAAYLITSPSAMLAPPARRSARSLCSAFSTSRSSARMAVNRATPENALRICTAASEIGELRHVAHGPCAAGSKMPSGALSPQHRHNLVEGPDARVHLHRLVEAVGVRGRVAAPAAFANDNRRDVEVEGLANARFYAAIGGAAADYDDVAPEHLQELGNTGSVKGARAALQEHVILGPRRDFVRKPRLRRALGCIRQRRHAGFCR